MCMFFTANPVHFAVGDFTWWQVMAAPGCNLLLLALFPTDARAIRTVCSAFFAGCCGVAIAVMAWQLTAAPVAISATAALCFALAAILFPTMPCRGRRAMPPRRALQRLWLFARILSFVLGVCNVGIVAARLATATSFVHFAYVQAALASSAVWLLCAAVATRRNRGRLHRRLGRLGRRGTEEEEAAAIAALVGSADPEATLKRAVSNFRCLPASQLLAADLAADLAAKTVPATMGEVTTLTLTLTLTLILTLTLTLTLNLTLNLTLTRSGPPTKEGLLADLKDLWA